MAVWEISNVGKGRSWDAWEGALFYLENSDAYPHNTEMNNVHVPQIGQFESALRWHYAWLRSPSLTCEDNLLAEGPWPSDSLSHLVRDSLTT